MEKNISFDQQKEIIIGEMRKELESINAIIIKIDNANSRSELHNILVEDIKRRINVFESDNNG